MNQCMLEQHVAHCKQLSSIHGKHKVRDVHPSTQKKYHETLLGLRDLLVTDGQFSVYILL